MKLRISIGVVGALLLAGLWLLWPTTKRETAASEKSAASSAGQNHSPSATKPASSTANKSATNNTSRFALRLTNTTKTLNELSRDEHAILLENAFIDTEVPLNLPIPSSLKASGDPGAYIVQAKGTINGDFRGTLAALGAQVVSYIPNNAYLVRLSGAGAARLQANSLVQSVMPYEPYYKLSSTARLGAVQGAAAFSPRNHSSTNTTTLLALAVAQKPLPAGTYLTLGLFADTAAATRAQIEKLGGKILMTDRSPFGEIVRVQPPADWVALVNLPGVQRVEPAYRRKRANDLSRPALGVSTNSVTADNYMGLTGKNVLVEVNDTGIDPTHPDLMGRVFGDFPGSLYDTDGHGTFVAGEIAGDGTRSMDITNASGSINPGTNSQYRGKAPLATLYSIGGISDEDGEGGHDTNAPISDSYFQEQPALTNALISNNSWGNAGDETYDLSAASYDAAVRDALPRVMGSQPVQFVFAAGNDGAGSDNGDGGNPDSISSPGTAKNVITVGAVELPRNITNIVTSVDENGTTNTVAVWSGLTDSGSQVASFSSRGNVGIGVEGTYGRFKPDVTAPGTFVVSTRSSTWDTNVYYNPTNYDYTTYPGQLIVSNGINYFATLVPSTAVGVAIQVSANGTNLPLYLSLGNIPGPGSADITSPNGFVSIPPDSGGAIAGIDALRGNLLNIAVGNNTSNTVSYDLIILTATTNNVGDYYQQLASLNDGLGGGYYRYESGTSMAAAEVSGVLALMQDFFTNTLSLRPSPALLKALLINGARATGFYDYQVQNNINFQGWGLVNLPNSLPLSLTNTASGTNATLFYLDQSITNALATGDARTYQVSLSPSAAATTSLRVTLAWTDPPGNPVAAIKLVNNLALVVTNLDDPANPLVFYGNDIVAGSVYNTIEGSNNVPLDNINNVQNVYLPPGVGTNFTVTVIGAAVNVNAVTAQTNDVNGVYAPNIVQDYALVVSCGDGFNTNGFTVTPGTPVSNPTNALRITDIATTNSPLLNQYVGASSPLMGTNQLLLGTNLFYGNGAVLTIGQTNQWHFYVVTNNAVDQNGQTSDVTNAAFVIFLPNTASIPREGVFAGSDANSTRPEADVDLFVTTDSNLLSLSPLTISNCLGGWQQVGLSVGGIFNGSSLGRGGSEYVVDTNSRPGQVYYIGVQSEDQMASEYGFLAEFSATPFSQLDANGNEIVQFFPVNIPDGDATHPGYTNAMGLAIYPIKIQRVVMTNYLEQQNAGDLVVSLNHSGAISGNGSVVLMNHDAPNAPGNYTYVYDDSGQNDVPGSQLTDGPGTLQSFMRLEGSGLWMLHAADNAPGFIGNISGSMFIQKHSDLTQQFVTVTLQPNTWFYGYVEVPAGYTNLTFVATNVSVENGTGPLASPPLEMFELEGAQPILTTFDQMAGLTNSYIPGLPYPSGPDPGNAILVGPPLLPNTYYLGIYNPSSSPQTVLVGAFIYFDANAITTLTDTSAGRTPLTDDAVTSTFIFVTNRDIIQDISVGLQVDHSRISDLAFTLISPDGSRYLLMENRGGASTNGAGGTLVITNTLLNSVFEGAAIDYASGQSVNGWSVTASQVSVVADPANAYQGSNFLALANGTITTTLPTQIGQIYNFMYAYRGPDAAGWWRGESNLVDVINNNSSSTPNGMGYAAGEVGQGFNMNGTNQYVLVYPSGASLDVGQGSGFTIECWIKPMSAAEQEIAEYERALGTSNSADVGVQLAVNVAAYPGSIFANIIDTGGANHIFTSPNNLIVPGVWQHVALVYNKNSGLAALYLNGNVVGQTNAGVFTAQTSFPNFLIGARTTFGSMASPRTAFFGGMDEISVYGRALSFSEIKAIYNNGIVGKYDPTQFISSPAQSLAKARVTIGSTTNDIFGDNTTWQTNVVTFLATNVATPIVFSGLEPGILLDALSVTNIQTNEVYLTFTEDTNQATTPIKFASVPFTPTNLAVANYTLSDFETNAGDTINPAAVDGWNVVSNQVSVVNDPSDAFFGNNFLALADSTISNAIPTIPGDVYDVTFNYRGPGMVAWWRGESNIIDSLGGITGYVSNGVAFVAGNVGTALHFDGNTGYVRIPANPALDVGTAAGMTVDCWIKPTDINTQRPLVVWAKDEPLTNVTVTLGPLASSVNGHYYYVTAQNTWLIQESIANVLGGHLATIRSTNEDVWVYNNITTSTPTRNPFIGLYSPTNYTGPGYAGPWNWISGEPVTYGPNWGPNEPNGVGGPPWAVNLRDGVYATKWNDSPQLGILEGIAETTSGVDFWQSVAGPGSLYANLLDTTNGSHVIYSAAGVLQASQYQHVALTYDRQSGIAKLYCNGIVVANTNLGFFTPKTTGNVMLGKPFVNVTGTSIFSGDMDEVGIYKRALSTSELKAIYTAGAHGKFDADKFTTSPSQSLAKAQFSINGVVVTNLFGDNANWQQQTLSFTATGTNSPLIIKGIAPGMLLDYFTVIGYGSNDLSYLPEQSLEPLIGTSAYGLWQMEVWDSRIGATNAAALKSWQLNFTFANTNLNATPSDTNYIFGVLTNGIEETNTMPVGNGMNWYRVNVPLNADIATNRLIFADQPLNVWFSTNVPPSTNALGDALLIQNSTNGAYIVFTNASPYLVPGGTYYLGLQNTNNVVVNYGVQVDFHLITNMPYAFTMAATKVTGTNAQLNGMVTPGKMFSGTTWFQWGVNTNYGGLTPPINVGVGTNVIYVTANVPMVPNLPFHYRLVVSNVSTVVYGFDQIFDEANVAVWGANYVGQANVPFGLSNVVAIAGAYDHSLALKNDGTPVAWGDNSLGQSTVPSTLSNSVVAVAGGQYYSLVLRTNGTVYAWGGNILAQTNVPAGLNGVAAIAGGALSSLALKTNGTIVAWGPNFSGLTNVPIGLSNVVAISGGTYHNAALKNDGTVMVWGDNSSGQTNVPSGLTNVVAISAGGLHTMALRMDGTVVAWGDDSSGQTNVPAGLRNVVAIAAGGFNSTVLERDGTILSWGDDSSGQTTLPFGMTNAVAIAAGNLHTMALTPLNLYSTNITHAVLIGGVAQTNTIFPNAIVYYQVNVPADATAATNILWFTQNGALDTWWTTNVPTTIGKTNDVLLFANATSGSVTLQTNTTPMLVPGATYYLGVHNTNTSTVTYGIEVDFLEPGTSTNSLTLPVQPNINAGAGVLMAVTNTATDTDLNATLFYTLQTVPANSAVISTNGIITWTPPLNATNQSFNFTTVVTDGTLSATNQFNVLVVMVPSFSGAVSMTNGIGLQWVAPTNEQFRIQYATNLTTPINWILLPEIITSTNGVFNFTDTNAPLVMKFYELLLLP